MTIKTKISLGLVFLFSVIVLLGGLGAFYLYQLSEQSQNILKNNYITLKYIQNIRQVTDDNRISSQDWAEIQKNLVLQEHNITEAGESEATQHLRKALAHLQDTLPDVSRPGSEADMVQARYWMNRLMAINMEAMVQKNSAAESKSQEIQNFMIVILTVCSLITFSFIVNFPGYIADPLHELTQAIGEVANRNYSKRIHFQTKDEFGLLASSFNDMALRLEQYEYSNLAQLIFEKRRIETIVDNLKDAILGLDEQNRILFLNPVMEHLLGLSEPIIRGQYAPDVASHNDLLGTLLAGEPSVLPLKIFANDQESYFTQETLEVLLTETDQPGNAPNADNPVITAGRVIVLKNITHFRERDLAKTNFIATISHELKTPISSIKMSLKLLTDSRVGDLNSEQQSLITHIREDSERLLKITGELLDLSQVETGNIQLHLRSVTPGEIVTYAHQTVRFQAEQKNVTLHTELVDPLPAVMADLEKTAWVLINFLSNAVRFSFEGAQVLIQVKSVTLHEQVMVRFSVKDAGKGIEKKYLNRIFDRYFQVPGSNPSKTGTGLGLAISKEFIEAQQGLIWVESMPGEGSTFHFALPVIHLNNLS